MRIPRREVAVQNLLNEQQWLPTIAARLPVPVPVPVAFGTPSELFPWPWSVVTWIRGSAADGSALPETQVDLLARTLRRLHRPSPADAPRNPFRGGPLTGKREAVEDRLRRLTPPRTVLDLWSRALAAQPAGATVWIHGDLHPRNVVLRDGIVAGLIDWGDMTGGDPATDLACAWMLFGPRGREELLDRYGADEEQRARAAGWAIHIGTVLADGGDTTHVALGRRILDRLSEDDSQAPGC
ncbi:MAG: phosphotransferase [Thermoanaerobaculia bacterium]|nr:phosphotransferase [Thermoanaerobaculia bacterium]